MKETRKLNILLADDHRLVREGLASLINDESDMRVVATCENGLATLTQADKLKPDVIVMDIAMPEMNGVEACSKISRSYPNIKIIALSVHTDWRYVTNMLSAGATGYLSKDCAFDELVKAIRVAMAGETYLSPKITGTFVEGALTAEDARETPLSKREREALLLIAKGRSTKEIAAELMVSVRTAEKFRTSLMQKLHIYNVADLTKYAIREGLISVS